MSKIKIVKEEIRRKCPVIDKTTEGHKYKYATLPDIYAILNPLLIEYGVGVDQKLFSDIHGITVTTTVFMMEDETDFDRSEMFVPWEMVALNNMTPIQSTGGTFSYCKRYSLVGMFNLLTEEDADQKEMNRKESMIESKKLDPDQCAFIVAKIKELEGDYEAFLKAYRVKRIEDIPQNKYRSILSQIDKKAGK